MKHLSYESLSELADASEEARAGSSHLNECADCRRQLEGIRAVVASARRLPREIAPPPEVWTEVRRGTSVRGAAGFKQQAPWLIAAAAGIVAIVSTTLLLMRNPAPTVAPAVVASFPAAVIAVENNYRRTIDELRFSIGENRESLSPQTLAVLERSLVVIDSAIAEARVALAADPANETLAGVLAANYKHKVELLQRATEWSSSL